VEVVKTGIAALANEVGLGSTDPSKMSAHVGARLMNYARKEHSEALRQTVEEKPWLIKSLGKSHRARRTDDGGNEVAE
jgi:hypothetical protein